MTFVVLAFTYCSFFGITAALVALARRRFRVYGTWAPPLNFGVATMLFANALTDTTPFHGLFVVSSYLIAAGGVLVLLKLIWSRRIDAIDAWVLSAASGALCAATYEHLPVVASQALALLCAFGGTLCFISWYKHLPDAATTQPS